MSNASLLSVLMVTISLTITQVPRPKVKLVGSVIDVSADIIERWGVSTCLCAFLVGVGNMFCNVTQQLISHCFAVAIGAVTLW